MKRILSFCTVLIAVLSYSQTETLNLTNVGTSTYTVPQGVTSLTVEAWGGGGGGGRSTGAGQATGGGGGGAYASSVVSVVANSLNSYFIGSGGSGEAGNSNNGSDTWFFNATTVLAKGGTGVSNNSLNAGSGGNASASIGTIKYSGGNGGKGSGKGGLHASGGGGGAAYRTGNGGNGENGAIINNGGSGGASSNPGGSGGAGASSGGAGDAGNTYGGAGGGSKKALIGGSNVNGGAGSQGLIRLSFTKPAITITPSSITICGGNAVTLTASSMGAYSYSWSNGATGALVSVSPTATTTYTVTGTAPNGAGGTFTHTQTVTVTVVNPVADIVFTSTPTPAGATACNLQYMTINTNVAVSYTPTTGLYTNAALTAPYTGGVVTTIYAAPNGTQIYTATATNGTCSKTNTITVERTPLSPVAITSTKFPTGASLCDLDYAQLTANQPAVFSPLSGLYTDAGLTVAYTGTAVTTVYAAPNGSQSYTATAGSGSCISTAIVAVTRNKKEFIAATPNADWDADANWFPAGRPTINQCVYIPSGRSVGVISSNGIAQASTVTVLDGGKLTIHPNADLTVAGKFTNESSVDNVVIESDGILKQSSNIANVGSITAKRTVSLSTERKQYNYLISPVNGQKMKYVFGANVSGAPFVQYVMRLNEPTNFFVNDGDGNYVKGKGYSVKEPNINYTESEAVFKGVPANGDFDYPLEYSASNRGYNLTGNPYPSNLDLYELYQESKNPDDDSYSIDSNIRFWDSEANNIFQQQGGNYQGYAYAVFNAASGSHGTGTAAPGGNGVAATGKTPNYIVKTGQAFMVRANYSGAKLLFRNGTQRISDQDESVFFGKKGKLPEDDRYWLEYYSPSGVVTSNAVVYFERGDNNFAVDDTRIPNSSASDALFTYAGTDKVIINGRSAFQTEDVLPVGTRHFVSGTYTLKLGKKEGTFKNGQSIYLKDKQLGILTDLTAGEYSFTSEAGEFTNRFEIIYKPGGVLASDNTTRANVQLYRDQLDFVLHSSGKKIIHMELYDMSGRLMVSKKANNKEVRFNAEILADGAYILRAQLERGEIVVKKIRK